MKGIILAGGAGTRLHPVTKAISKQIIPIYDKPMIYYPLSVFLTAGIKDILIISTPRDIGDFKELFGNGQNLGVQMYYAVQEKPRGLADAFIIGESFIGRDSVALILGDNIFYGDGFERLLEEAAGIKDGATVFGYRVNKPQAFGVVTFDDAFHVVSIEEKPERPKSNYAVPGLYFYDHSVSEIAKQLVPSPRGELEITDVNNEYLKRNKLSVQLLPQDVRWIDTGTHKALLKAANAIEAYQTTSGTYIGCIEEIAYKKGYISKNKLLTLANQMSKTEYGMYLKQIAFGVRE